MDLAHRSFGPAGGARVLAAWWLSVKLDWWRRARWSNRLVVAACRGPRIWLRQKQRSCEVWMASLGIGILSSWGLDIAAAGKVGLGGGFGGSI